jgi:hypothetical protein
MWRPARDLFGHHAGPDLGGKRPLVNQFLFLFENQWIGAIFLLEKLAVIHGHGAE